VAVLVFLDDKHKISVGEPHLPLAAVDRGKKVLIGTNSPVKASDHDFSVCSLTPSVSLICDIPLRAEESFYRGKVFVGLKDSIFEGTRSYSLFE